MDSILTSVKKMLGITEEYTHFDPELIMHINTTFAILQQLGVGPNSGFSIADKSATWNDFLADDRGLNMVKTYMFQRVRLMFDPPQNSAVIEVIKEQIKEFETRARDHVEFGDAEDQNDESESGN